MAWMIRCVVKDKNVLPVMRYLEEFAVEPPALTEAHERLGAPPTIPAAVSHSERHQGPHNGASAHVDVLVTNAKQAGLKQITGKQLVQHMKMGGFGNYSYGYRLNQLLHDKVLKRTRQHGVYEVV